MKMNLLPHPAMLAGLALVAACGGLSGDATSDGLLVVTTVSPITNLAANIVCERAEVIGLVPEGVNSHTFAPAPSDAATLADADVMFVNGLNLELPTIELAETNVAPGVDIVSLGAAALDPADYIFDFSFPEDAGDPNPHLWTNPRHARTYAEVIAATMTELDPGGESSYRTNLEELGERIDQLDAAIREATASIPPERRRLLTYHDSFPYFAREYGWEVIGAIQPSDFAEPTAREVAGLIEQIRAEDVPAIFGSEVFPSPVLSQIAAEADVRYVDELRDDDLPGEPGDPEHSYLGLMVFDLRTMVDALDGDSSPLDRVPTDNLCDQATYGT